MASRVFVLPRKGRADAAQDEAVLAQSVTALQPTHKTAWQSSVRCVASLAHFQKHASSAQISQLTDVRVNSCFFCTPWRAQWGLTTPMDGLGLLMAGSLCNAAHFTTDSWAVDRPFNFVNV